MNPAIVVELASPPHGQGKAGYILAALAALLIVPRFGWRWSFIPALVPALLVFATRRSVPESVRFAATQGERRPRLPLLSLRGTAFGLMVGGGRIVSIGAPFLVRLGIAAYGPKIPFLATSVLWLGTILGYLLGPQAAS